MPNMNVNFAAAITPSDDKSDFCQFEGIEREIQAEQPDKPPVIVG